MGYPIRVTVRFRSNAYQCCFPNGTRASSTHSPGVAVERLMDKTWEPGTHRASRVDGLQTTAESEWEISPIDERAQ